MKKRLLTIAALLTMAIGVQAQSYVQQLLGPRFLVNSPSSVAGLKKFSASNKGAAATTATNNWGRLIDSTWLNMQLVKASDTLGCSSALTNMSGKFALIYRGTCNFTVKAYNCMQAGAWGVVIVNNVPGEINFTMSPSTDSQLLHNLPCIIISQEDGNALDAQLNAGNPVSVSLTGWGFGKANDLSMIGNNSRPPYGAMPAPQLANGAGATQYRFYNSGFFANTGTADAANPVFVSSVNFTPTGGSPTNVWNDSVSIATFPVTDSITGLISPNSFDPDANQTGRYDIIYSVHADAADELTGDNTQTGSMYVTAGTFCSARYDSANDQPISDIGYRLKDALGIPTYISGPLFFNAKGGYQALYSKLSIADQDTNKHDLSAIGNTIYVMLYKWLDNNADQIMETDELTYSGIANVNFTTTDSNSHFKTSDNFQYVPVSGGNPTNVILEDNTFYWMAAVVPNDYYLGVDSKSNYYSRALAAARNASPVIEFYSPQYWGDADPNTYLPVDPTDTIRLYPFTAKSNSYLPIDSLGISTFADGVASMSLHVSPTPTAVKNVEAGKINVALYPNPTTDAVHVKFDLDKVAATTYINIMTAGGQVAYSQMLSNVQKDDVSIATSKFAAGNYLMVIRSGKDIAVRQFTVVGK